MVTGIQTFQKTLDKGVAGGTSACFSAALRRMNWTAARSLAPGLSSPHEVEAEVFVISKEEGGRHTPIFPGYSPQFSSVPPT